MSLEIKEFTKKIGQDPFIEEYRLFIDMISRLSILDNKIVIDKKIIGGMHERFMHAVSCEEQKLKDKDYPPCVNELAMEVCATKCNSINSRFCFKEINRVECLYRLSRISWIEDMISMLEDNDERISCWKYEKKDFTNNKYKMHWYLRYKEGGKDFLVVFREDKDKLGNINLNFRTAYPVYLPGDKYKLDKEYRRAIKEGYEIKKPAFV
ncbi:hypothetical protein [Clostridium thermobutyricum]|uniref:hypothetical protein n=1 Tax=Clostridium thermobutyricum TaxID=29372 RepID=UPI003F524E95